MRGLAIGILLAACGATSGVAGLVVGAVRDLGDAEADLAGREVSWFASTPGKDLLEVPRLAARPCGAPLGCRADAETRERHEGETAGGPHGSPGSPRVSEPPSERSADADPRAELAPIGIDARGPNGDELIVPRDQGRRPESGGGSHTYDVARLLAEAPDAPDAPRRYPCVGATLLRLTRLLCDLAPAPGDLPIFAARLGSVGTLELSAEPAPTALDISRAESLLSVWAARGGEAVPIDVETYARGEELAHVLGAALPGEGTSVEAPRGIDGSRVPAPLGRLHLDVPYDHRVRAFSGASVGYLCDYDISGSMVMTDLTAYLGAADVGVAAAATSGVVPRDGLQWIDLDVTWTHDLAILTTLIEPRPQYGFPAVSLEDAHLEMARYRGRLSVEAGRRWLVGLSGGAAALVRVGTRACGPALEAAWRRVHVDRFGHLVPETEWRGAGRRPEDLLRVGWLSTSCGRASGVLDVEIGDGPPVVARTEASKPLHIERSASADGGAEEPRSEPEDLTALAGGVQVTVSRLPPEADARSFDVVFDVGARDDRLSREVLVSTSVERPTPTALLRLPTTHRTSIPLRIRLRPGEIVSRTVLVDVTGQAEPWTLTFERR